jgi:hypothetical protein
LNISATELAGFGTLGAGVIAAASCIISSFINKRSEERKHLRELIVKTTADNWKFIVEKSANPIHQRMPRCLIYEARMIELALDKGVTSPNRKEKLEEVSKMLRAMEDHTKAVARGQ